jgi:predicted ester cyclase
VSLEANKALVRRQFDEIWNGHNLDVIDELFAADYVGHLYPFPAIQGPKMVKKIAVMLRTGFPDSHYTVDDQIAEGDKVATRYTFYGTHTGDYQGFPPTGKPAQMTGTLISQIADGKFIEEWLNIDFLGQRQQLGLIPQ